MKYLLACILLVPVVIFYTLGFLAECVTQSFKAGKEKYRSFSGSVTNQLDPP